MTIKDVNYAAELLKKREVVIEKLDIIAKGDIKLVLVVPGNHYEHSIEITDTKAFDAAVYSIREELYYIEETLQRLGVIL